MHKFGYVQQAFSFSRYRQKDGYKYIQEWVYTFQESWLIRTWQSTNTISKSQQNKQEAWNI